jgi:hypothetical protein
VVEPDVELVELCAASMDTEKHNAAALVSSFFMVFVLLVVRHNLPTILEMRAIGAGLPSYRLGPMGLRLCELRELQA